MEKVLDTRNEEPSLSRNASAALECLPPAAEREAMSLQSFFLFHCLLENKEIVLLLEEEPFTVDYLVD